MLWTKLCGEFANTYLHTEVWTFARARITTFYADKFSVSPNSIETLVTQFEHSTEQVWHGRIHNTACPPPYMSVRAWSVRRKKAKKSEL